MGKSRRNGFVETERECCGIGLGLMMETHDQSCKKMNQMVMVMPHHEPQFCSGGFDGGTATPLFYPTRNNNAVTTDIYNTASSDVGSVVVPKNLQQPYYDSLSFSSSVGGMVNVNVRIPFTPAQRAELEAQTVIYKYIMACVPVPQQLLLSITNSSPNGVRNSSRTRGVRDMFEGFSKSLDPEPWRCKRTDGKKWRCSRDRGVDQKFCERHCHKRRSRKLVESIPNLLNNNINKNANMLSPRPSAFKNYNQTPLSSSMVTPAAASHAQPRALDWFMNGESASVAVSNQEWEQLMPFKLGSHTSKRDTDVDFPKQQNESSLNLYRGGSQGLQSQRSHDHLGGALNSNQAQQTRHFIDAWSTERAGNGIDELGKRTRDSVPLNQKLPLSSLTLSMSGKNSEANEENGNRQMGVGVLGSERQNVTQWMSPLSWMSSTPGGPLAEALCLGIASSTRTTSTNGCRNSNADVRQEFDLIN